MDTSTGQKIKHYRTEKGWAQRQLCAAMVAAGFSTWGHQTTLSLVERDRRRLTLEEAAVLAGLFEVSVDHLAGVSRGDASRTVEMARLRSIAQGGDIPPW